ncbi:hypothetical protein QE152_g1015 [Popillia japonica]|uniref:Uncharacterized protein n=1 Tax=Popillia japonica TaxID=7064 RepID=A0AAW1N429_POPJA
MSRKLVTVWSKQFKSRRTALNDDPKGMQCKPSTTTTDEKQLKVDALIREDRQLKIRKISLLTGIPKGWDRATQNATNEGGVENTENFSTDRYS